MTDYIVDKAEIEKERKYREDKEAAGYIRLRAELNHFISSSFKERLPSIYTEAIAANLIFDKESIMPSARELGITDAGKKFFFLSEFSIGGNFKDFYINPGEIQGLINYLDASPDAIRAKLAYKENIASRVSQQQEQIKKELKDIKREYKTPEKYNSENESKKHPPNDENASGAEKSPSIQVLLFSYLAMIPLVILKVLYEDEHGRHAANEAFNPIFITIIIGAPLFVALRFIFKNGNAESPQRFKSLMIGFIILLVAGWAFNEIGLSGESSCTYKVGCI